MDHTADLTVYFYGRSPEEVFTNAGMVMFELLLEGKADGKIEETRIVLDGVDYENMLIQWLSELLFIYSIRDQALVGVKFNELSPTGLEARAELAGFDPELIGVKTEVKAVTYHRAEFIKKGSGYRARITFDL